MLALSLAVLHGLLVIAVTYSEDRDICRYYLAPSLRHDQYGVYAGKRLDKNEIIESPPVVTVKHKDVADWQLDDFIFESSEPKFEQVVFGVGMMLAGAVNGNVNILSTDSNHVVSEPIEVSDASFDTYFEAAELISAGEELFAIFGEDYREVLVETAVLESDGPPSDVNESPELAVRNTTYDVATLKAIGHCLTDVYVQNSGLSGAGLGLFTKISRSAGEVVSISPTLILPKHSVMTMDENHSSLINYCYCANGSDVALLPFGLAAMINHGSAERANVKMQWHERKDGRKSRLTWPLETLERLDEDPPLFVEYVALRDLHPDEELLIDYGNDWTAAWDEHTRILSESMTSTENCIDATDSESEESSNKKECELHSLPVFRHPIGTTFFPDSFSSVCIGRDNTSCMILRNEHRINSDPALVARREMAMLHSFKLKDRIHGGQVGTTKMDRNGVHSPEEPTRSVESTSKAEL